MTMNKALGDQFISSKEVKTRLIQEFQGDCAEMEGASIAHGAYLNDIPFVIIRAISDKADDSAEMDYPTFEKAAALHSAKLVEAMMPRIWDKWQRIAASPLPPVQIHPRTQ